MEHFKIICISSCDSIGPIFPAKIEIGEIFDINDYEFNYAPNKYLRLIIDGKIIGLFSKIHFKKLENYRNEKIENILK